VRHNLQATAGTGMGHLRRRRLARLQVPYRYGTTFVRRSRRPSLQAAASAVDTLFFDGTMGTPFIANLRVRRLRNLCSLFSHVCGLVANWELANL
jgi:hypothetical protein